jgi:hypothetical protein
LVVNPYSRPSVDDIIHCEVFSEVATSKSPAHYQPKLNPRLVTTAKELRNFLPIKINSNAGPRDVNPEGLQTVPGSNLVQVKDEEFLSHIRALSVEKDCVNDPNAHVMEHLAERSLNEVYYLWHLAGEY